MSNPANVDKYLEELQNQNFFKDEDTEGSIRWYIKWYRDKAPTSRKLFRSVGFLLLLLSISLPVVVSLITDANTKAVVASILSWLVALLGASNGFFQWNKSWQRYIETQIKLEQFLMNWELVAAKCKLKQDEKSFSELANQTITLVNEARAAIVDETKSYFEEVKFTNLNINTHTENT